MSDTADTVDKVDTVNKIRLTIGTPEHTEALRTAIRTHLLEEEEVYSLGEPIEVQEDIVNLLTRYYDVNQLHVEDLLADFREEDNCFIYAQYDLLKVLRGESLI